MSRPFDLIGVGNALMDSLVPVTDDFLTTHVSGEKGGMVLADPSEVSQILGKLGAAPAEVPGGSVANSVIGAQRLGLKTTFIGKIGPDAIGQRYRDGFARVGVDASRFKVGPLPTGHCLSLVTPDSQRTMRTALGAASTLTPEEIVYEDFADCRHAQIEGYLLFNPDLARKALRTAHEAGCSVGLDLSSFEVVRASSGELHEWLEKYVDVVFSNEDEAAAFTGLKDDYEAMARQLGTLCRVAVVKLGKDGALICENGKITRVSPVWVDQPVDTTGAGDLWASGFLAGWLKGWTLEKCGALASLTGAEVVKVMGASIPEDRWPHIHAAVV
jgi:sugar/nucleoside kinase (ribokinase family)